MGGMMIDIIIRASLIAFVIATCYSLKKIFSEIERMKRRTGDIAEILMGIKMESFLNDLIKEKVEEKE